MATTPESLESQQTLGLEARGPAAEVAFATRTSTYPGLARSYRRRPQRDDEEPSVGRESMSLDEGVGQTARRDGLGRRLLATADIVAAAAAFIVSVSLLGHDALGIGAAIAVAMVIPICK